MTKTYANQCLEIAYKAQIIAIDKHFGLETGCDAYIELERLNQELRNDIVPELVRRLNEALNAIRESANSLNSWSDQIQIVDPFSKALLQLADELEEIPEGGQ